MTTITATAVPRQRMATDQDQATNESWPLIQRAQAGDMEAFGLLYETYQGPVFRFILFRVGASNRALAEDLTGDVFVRALKGIGNFTWQGRDVGAWLMTIARNLVVDYFKSSRYRCEHPVDGFGGVLEEERHLVDADADAYVAVETDALGTAVRAALDRLNPNQQQCLRLRYLSGLSVAATAKAMGTTEGAIKALTLRAVAALLRTNPELEAWR